MAADAAVQHDAPRARKARLIIEISGGVHAAITVSWAA
jgi:hypothetical protein